MICLTSSTSTNDIVLALSLDLHLVLPLYFRNNDDLLVLAIVFKNLFVGYTTPTIKTRIRTYSEK